MGLTDYLPADNQMYIWGFFIVLVLVAIYFLYIRGPPKSKSSKKDEAEDEKQVDEIIEKIKETS